MSKPGRKAAPAADAPPPGSLKLAFLGWYGVIGMALGYVLPFKLPFAESYAKEHWRHALASLVLVLMLLTGLASLAFHLLSANDFKSQIVDYVKTHQQRDLVLEGDIEIAWFPRLGLETGRMNLSERNSSQRFASVDNARLYVAWWPLLRKRVQVERIVLDGLHARLLRHPDGRTNVDDLLQPAGWMGELQFAVEKIRVLDATLDLHDEASGRSAQLLDLQLETGRLADAMAGPVQASGRLLAPQSAIDLQLRLDLQLLYDHSHQRYDLGPMEGQARGQAGTLQDLQLDWRGRLSAWPGEHKLVIEPLVATWRSRLNGHLLQGRLAATRVQRLQEQWQARALELEGQLSRDETQTQTYTLQAAALEAGPQGWHSPELHASVDLRQGALTLQGRGRSPLQYDTAQRQLLLESLQSDWSLGHPLLATRLQAQASGKLSAALATREAVLDLQARVDEHTLGGRLQRRDGPQPAWRFELSASALDLDRYLVSGWPQRLQQDTEAQDLAHLHTLDVRGRLRSGSVRAAGLRAREFSAELRAAAGTLDVDALSAQLYGGSLQGSLSVTAGDPPRLSLRQKFTGVQLDALLADARAGDPPLAGKGNLTLELKAQGSSLAALRAALSGTASLALTDGTLAGLDLPEGLLAGKDQLGLPGALRRDSLRPTEHTGYRELKASFTLDQGRARCEDLLLRTTHTTSRGELDLALDSAQVDGWLDATVAPGLKRAVAGELAELAGITIPLRINGPWGTASVSYHLGEASGSRLPQLARLNLTRQSASLAEAPATAPPPAARNER